MNSNKNFEEIINMTSIYYEDALSKLAEGQGNTEREIGKETKEENE